MILVPLTRDQANAFLAEHHRHSGAVPGHRAAVLEIDPRYCDVIVRRWQEFTGRQAERVAGWRGP